jgi:hypothetical protein
VPRKALRDLFDVRADTGSVAWMIGRDLSESILVLRLRNQLTTVVPISGRATNARRRSEVELPGRPTFCDSRCEAVGTDLVELRGLALKNYEGRPRHKITRGALDEHTKIVALGFVVSYAPPRRHRCREGLAPHDSSSKTASFGYGGSWRMLRDTGIVATTALSP